MTLKLKAQLMVGEEIAFGPGKAALLQAIAAHGSISGAARAMGLSYRRAWLMVETMNRLFSEPLVLTRAGGAGGAALSPAGAAVLADYAALAEAILAAAIKPGARLAARLR